MTQLVRVSDELYAKAEPLINQGLTQSEAFDRLFSERNQDPDNSKNLHSSACPWIPDTDCPILSNYNIIEIQDILKLCRSCPSHIKYIEELKHPSDKKHTTEDEELEEKFKAHYQPQKYPLGKCGLCDKEAILHTHRTRDGNTLKVCSICKFRAVQVNA